MRQLTAAAMLLASTAALAYEVKTDSTGHEVRWKGRFVLTVDSRFAKDVRVDDAVHRVELALGELQPATRALELARGSGERLAMGYDAAPGAKNENALVAIDRDWPFDENALAVTIVTMNTTTHEIIDADIAFNTDRYRFGDVDDTLSPDARLEGGVDDLQNTLTHELGHALGLKHNPADAAAVMYPGAVTGEVSKRHLAADDRQGLGLLYDAAMADAPPVGCSAAGGGFPWWLGALAVAVIARPRQRRALAAVRPALVLGACVAMPLAAQAQSVPAPVEAKVLKVATLPPRPGQRVWATRLTVQVQNCPATEQCEHQLVVPGGRVGDLEQVIDDQPTPAVGDAMLVIRVGQRVERWRKGATVNAEPITPRSR
ncbi:MAG: matrixin family metalloprotease [Myxococcaceae bacterium]|nr:matrixin family metalloprotease [Myxococcaceae bacterium]